MGSKRHKWSGSGGKRATSNHGGLAVCCLKCGCVKEFVSGKATYFIDDKVYLTAPFCDGIMRENP